MNPTAEVLTSSKSVEWWTPQWLVDQMEERFAPQGFTLDPAARPENTKAYQFFTAQDDGLAQVWTGRVFCNPPYGRSELENWVPKAVRSVVNGQAESVTMLLPARTSTKWFHECAPLATEAWFVKGRIPFLDHGVETNHATFPSLILYFNGVTGGNVWRTWKLAKPPKDKVQ